MILSSVTHKIYTLENERMSPEKGPFQKGISSSNRYFSGNMLVSGGVGFTQDLGKGWKRCYHYTLENKYSEWKWTT